jgi:hypothetical protein
MTTQKTRAVVEGLTKRDIHTVRREVHKRKVRTACARWVRKAAVRRLVEAGSIRTPTKISHGFARPSLQKHSTCIVPGTATASAKKLGVRGHGGVTASREAATCERNVVFRRAKIQPQMAATLYPLPIAPIPWHKLGLDYLPRLVEDGSR